jgi:hypothetical protein
MMEVSFSRNLDCVLEAKRSTKLEARGGIEPPIKVLQTFALPLGYRAIGELKL